MRVRKAKISCMMISVVFILLLPSQLETVFASALGQRIILDNGIILVVSKRPDIPMVVLDVLIKAGSVAEPEEKAGLANLTAELLTQGTTKRTAREIAREIDFMGASLFTSADYDYSEANLIILKKYIDKGFELLGDILIHPTFPPEEIEKKVRETLGELRKNEEDPGWVAKHKFLKIVFKDHPYGRLVKGNEESLKKISRNDIVDFYSNYYLPDRIIVSIAGDINLQEAKSLIDKNFGNWPTKEEKDIKTPPPPLPLKETISVELDRNVTQANIILGHLGITRDNPDYYPLQVMNYILGGGGFSSRLVNVIRGKEGLAYSVGSAYKSRKHSGYFQVELQAKYPSAKEAIQLVLENIKRIQKNPVLDKELEGAKSYLIGSLPLRIETNEEVAANMALLEFYNLGLDYLDKYPGYIKAVSKDDVLRVAQKYLYPDKFALVVVANLEEANIK